MFWKFSKKKLDDLVIVIINVSWNVDIIWRKKQRGLLLGAKNLKNEISNLWKIELQYFNCQRYQLEEKNQELL